MKKWMWLTLFPLSLIAASGTVLAGPDSGGAPERELAGEEIRGPVGLPPVPAQIGRAHV